ncbi:hypothetical protein LCGC14_0606280 [marine sediment metagenome]|uniref:Uncharacterized protein n=1 Tax=marine sediment metagenome TaxID=412755 RepID=A0A0F9RDU5_9ZZZZ
MGTRLISTLDFSSSGIKLRNPNWFEKFYEYEVSMENGVIISYESNFYAVYTFGTGNDLITALQDTTVLFEHMDPYKEPLPNYIVSKSVSKMKDTLPDYKVPVFKDFSTLIPKIKKEVIEVFNSINQFVNFRLSSKKYRFNAISDLIISKAFYDKDFNIIESLLNELDPTSVQLSDLSNSRQSKYSDQKLLYHTFHEILKGYSGSNKIINDYKKLHDYLTFGALQSKDYTKNEFRAIEMIEEILPQLFGYRFVTLLKLGALSFSKEDGKVKFQPIAFSRWLSQDILNDRRINSVREVVKVYQKDNIASNFETILACLIAFGHTTTFYVTGLGVRTISTFAADYNSFIAELVDGTFRRPYNPASRFKDYGSLTQALLSNFRSLILPSLEAKRNSDGKTAIMNGFARLFQARFNPSTIRLLGVQSNIKEFRNNPNTVSKSSINYAILKTFELLIRPTRTIDPIGTFRNIYRGASQTSSFIIKGAHGWDTIWSTNPRPDRLNTITLDNTILTQFFGNDFSTIQPALYYTERNLQDNVAHTGYRKPLLSDILTSEFIAGIDHLYGKFYNALSTYTDGEKLTVTFHQDTSHGIHENSLLSKALPEEISEKFNDLLGKDANSLSIVIQKESGSGKLLNEEEFQHFISDIVFYLVMFNSIALIQEIDGNYGLIASQRELFTADYIFQLNNPQLSETGHQILNMYQSEWNKNEEDKIVWNYGDC